MSTREAEERKDAAFRVSVVLTVVAVMFLFTGDSPDAFIMALGTALYLLWRG